MSLRRLINIQTQSEHFTLTVFHTRQGNAVEYWNDPGRSKAALRGKEITGAVSSLNPHLAVKRAIDQILKIDGPIVEMIESRLANQRLAVRSVAGAPLPSDAALAYMKSISAAKEDAHA